MSLTIVLTVFAKDLDFDEKATGLIIDSDELRTEAQVADFVLDSADKMVADIERLVKSEASEEVVSACMKLAEALAAFTPAVAFVTGGAA